MHDLLVEALIRGQDERDSLAAWDGVFSEGDIRDGCDLRDHMHSVCPLSEQEAAGLAWRSRPHLLFALASERERQLEGGDRSGERYWRLKQARRRQLRRTRRPR